MTTGNFQFIVLLLIESLFLLELVSKIASIFMIKMYKSFEFKYTVFLHVIDILEIFTPNCLLILGQSLVSNEYQNNMALQFLVTLPILVYNLLHAANIVISRDKFNNEEGFDWQGIKMCLLLNTLDFAWIITGILCHNKWVNFSIALVFVNVKLYCLVYIGGSNFMITIFDGFNNW